MEVTRNWDNNSEWYGTYHPHFHILLAVPTNYFSKNYIKQSEWTDMWQRAMKLDYTPIVHVANGALNIMAYWHIGLKNYVIMKQDV